MNKKKEKSSKLIKIIKIWDIKYQNLIKFYFLDTSKCQWFLSSYALINKIKEFRIGISIKLCTFNNFLNVRMYIKFPFLIKLYLFEMVVDFFISIK